MRPQSVSSIASKSVIDFSRNQACALFVHCVAMASACAFVNVSCIVAVPGRGSLIQVGIFMRVQVGLFQGSTSQLLGDHLRQYVCYIICHPMSCAEVGRYCCRLSRLAILRVERGRTNWTWCAVQYDSSQPASRSMRSFASSICQISSRARIKKRLIHPRYGEQLDSSN